MINAERILGSLLKQGLKKGKRKRRRRRRRSSGLGGLASGAAGATLGMGVLGVAIAAFEHFTSKQNSAASSAQPAAAPPGAPRQTGATPPPPPGPAPSTPPPPPPGVELKEAEAELLVRAMVAAAHADGEIDAKELKVIRSRLAEGGLSEEERDELDDLLANPPSLADILKSVDNPRLAAQVYAVTLATIELDTDAEQQYLEILRAGLKIPDDVTSRLHEEFGINDD